ncbi:MAG: tetratricopeptide repeat protein [Candidatus Heimdallarchaeota archaeon]
MTEAGIEKFENALNCTKNGDYHKACTLYNDLIQSSVSVYSIISQDIFKINEWEYLQDISDCEKKVNTDEPNFDACMALAFLFKIAGNTERRNMFIQKALKINSNNAHVWREYGEAEFHLGNIRQSLLHFQEAVNLDAIDSISYEGIGLCFYYLDEPIKAITPLKKSLSLLPNNHIVMNHLSFILSELGELKEAEDLIKKALKYEVKNNVYLDTYACVLFLQEKHQESLKIFEKILVNKPKEWEISWDILSHLYEILGLHVKAKQIEEKLFI